MSSPPIKDVETIELGLAHHREGRLAEAEAVYKRILAAQPERPDALHFLGLLELQCGRTGSAARFMARAIEMSPAYAEPHNGLGLVAQSEGRLDDAIRHFTQATVAKPGWGAAYFNLGLTLKRAGDPAGAAAAFTTGWARDPDCLQAAGQCVATIAEQARSSTISPPLVHADTSRHFVSVVVCSIDDVKCDRTTSLYHRVLENVPHEVIAIRDARSLAEAYNRALDRCMGDLIVLSHDDIDILAPDFAARLVRHLQAFDVVGVVGGTLFKGPQWKSCGHPHLRGWITHRSPDGERYVVGVLSPRPVSDGMATLDGVFLAAHRDVFSDVRFDDAAFDGFHLYDIDWSHRAAEFGFRLGVAGDLLIVHESRGRFRDEWLRYADRFCAKHRVAPCPDGQTMLFEAELETPEQVRQFYAGLDTLTAGLAA